MITTSKNYRVPAHSRHLARTALPLLLAACAASGDGESGGPPWPAPEAAPELGTVRWCRDLELAEEHARRLDAPILLVFQEVPG